MKIILHYSDPCALEILSLRLRQLGHLVLHAAPAPPGILVALARHQPHWLILEETPSAQRLELEALLDHLAVTTPILWLPAGLSTEQLASLIQAALDAPTVPPPLIRYAVDRRLIIHDQRYQSYASAEKQNVPPASPAGPDELAAEMAVFTRQVEEAKRHHHLAEHYLRQVLLTDRGLRPELAYRAVHSSYKIFWLREHVFRWAGVLAHYVLGVEPAHLPPPAPLSSAIDYLHYTSPPENYYAATALLMHGFKPSWMDDLRGVLARKFTGQNEVDLLRETLVLSGWSALLREIAIAQVRVMSCALDPHTPWYSGSHPPRLLHRATGIFCDFWHLRRLRQEPQHLRPLADGVVVDGAATPEVVPVVPPFLQFLDLFQSTAEEQKN